MRTLPSRDIVSQLITSDSLVRALVFGQRCVVFVQVGDILRQRQRIFVRG